MSKTTSDGTLTRHVLTPRDKRRLVRLIYDLSETARELLDAAATEVQAHERDGYAELRHFADLATVRRDLEEREPLLKDLF